MALRYIADPEQAAQRNREGLRFLYGLQFPGDIPALGKDCKAAVASQTASWLALGLKATAAETKSLLLNGILDRLFQLDTTDASPSKTQFAAVLATLKPQGLLKPAKALLNQIIELLAARRQTQAVLAQSRQRSSKAGCGASPRFVEYQRLMEELLPQDFLSRLRLDEAGERRRWLLALAKRIERAEHAPLKDEEKAKRVQPVVERLRELERRNAGPRCAACREEIRLCRRMVEEFRVSVFAPEMGTAFPVSEKRLDAQMQQAEDVCRRVE
uniref:DUF3418 domain-containing protein n=1 Tax=Candidatus Electronema sp. TaxID=2698783 RepID=UPI0040578F1D